MSGAIPLPLHTPSRGALAVSQQDRQCTYNVTLRRVGATKSAMGKQ